MGLQWDNPSAQTLCPGSEERNPIASKARHQDIFFSFQRQGEDVETSTLILSNASQALGGSMLMLRDL